MFGSKLSLFCWGITAIEQRRSFATLKDISIRLKSVRNIQKITKSMKMVSAAKYNKAERELRVLFPFFFPFLISFLISSDILEKSLKYDIFADIYADVFQVFHILHIFHNYLYDMFHVTYVFIPFLQSSVN